jgi:Zn-dependent peptidase ImmA (M78 family)/transcriptional regulator with XRE-family HTH domain
VIGERVRHAREYHGWSGTELADRVGTSQPTISRLEHNTYTSAELVDQIADATGYSRWWFEQGPLPDLPKGTLKFRKKASSSVRDDERVRAHVRQAIEVVERVGHRPEAPPVRVRPLRPDDVITDVGIEDLALDVREQLGVGPTDPIPNLVRAIERAGIVVIGSVVSIDKHDGASYWPDCPFGRPLICVSRGVPGDRERLSVGHELGHLILHQYGSHEPKDAERQANRFAGALLVPASEAIAELGHGPVTLHRLAHAKARWGVSIAAFVMRCFDLQLIDKQKQTSLLKQISARGWRRSEPVEVPYESPRLLQRLLEISSEGRRAQAMTGLPPLAIRDLIA